MTKVHLGLRVDPGSVTVDRRKYLKETLEEMAHVVAWDIPEDKLDALFNAGFTLSIFLEDPE